MTTHDRTSKVELAAQLKVAIASYNIALRDMNKHHPNVKVVQTTNHDSTLLLTIIDEVKEKKEVKEEVYYENQRRYVVRQS